MPQKWCYATRKMLLIGLMVAYGLFGEGSLSVMAIINGNTVTLQEQEDKGLVRLKVGCSAVLLANDWLLTAGHCIANNRDPFSVTAVASWETLGNESRQSDAIYQFADGNEARNVDLALVHLSSPFTVHGATTGFANHLNMNATASLNQQTLAVYGRGINEFPNLGGGTWRAADLTVGSVNDSHRTFTWTPNGLGQIAGPGDSGGPYFIFQNGVPLISGIHSGSVRVCTNPSSQLTCLQTMTAITSVTATSIPAMQSAIRAVLASQWHPTAISEPVWVLEAEIQSTLWGLTDVNQVHWAQAARAAAEMCYNRGFAAGHFDGHQDLATDGFGIQCSGQGVFWTDVTANQIAATGWGFTNINTVSWTRANRAAERLCAGFNQGFAGGHFNGHMVNGQYGLFCYKDGAKWFDATTAEIAATGWGWSSGDMDTEPWAQGARAATGFCRGKGYSGGFMNGQINRGAGLYGVVCQGNTLSGDSSALPTLKLNYTSGLPESFFILSGSNFPPQTQETIRANGHEITRVQIDASGNFRLIIYTSADDNGHFIFASTNYAGSRVELTLHDIALYHSREAEGLACNLQGNCTLDPPNPDPEPNPVLDFLNYFPLLRNQS